MISADSEIQPDALAALAASAALAVSDIPFNGPISEVRVAKIDGKYVINMNLVKYFYENSEFGVYRIKFIFDKLNEVVFYFRSLEEARDYFDELLQTLNKKI